MVSFFKEIGNHLLAIVNEIIPFVSNKDNRAKKVSINFNNICGPHKNTFTDHCSC